LFADVAVVFANGPGMPVLALVDLTGIERKAVASFDNSRCIADLVILPARRPKPLRLAKRRVRRRFISSRCRRSSPRTNKPAARKP
jgi:hypothetical protein